MAQCKDCLVFTLGSERKLPYRSARRPRVRRTFSFVILSCLPPPLSPSLSTRPPAQDKPRTNHFPSHSHSLPLSPFHLICFSLSLYFRQRRSTLSRSSTALVRSRTFLYTFLFIFADIFSIFPSTIFLNVRHNDDAFTYPSSTPTFLPTGMITKA